MKSESAVRANLAAAGLSKIPMIVQIEVTTDPLLTGKLRALIALHFALASADLPPDAIRALAALVPELRRNDLQIIVVGHADATGRVATNDDLSQRRADVVRTALVKAGVAEERITALGEGARMPIADNATASGRAANRRATIPLGAIELR